jgi:hypothetical protein
VATISSERETEALSTVAGIRGGLEWNRIAADRADSPSAAQAQPKNQKKRKGTLIFANLH